MKRYLWLSLFTAGLVLAAWGIAVHAQQPARASMRGVPPTFEDPGLAATGSQVVAPLDTATFYAIADTYIYSASPTQTHGSATMLYVGSQTTGDAGRALFRFNLASLPTNAIVDSATFQTYMSSTSSIPPVLSVGVYRINAEWAEHAVHWVNQPPAVPIGAVAGVSKTLQYYAWEVAALAQVWVNNPASNFGLELRSETEGTVGWRGFASREAVLAIRPQLVIEYHLPACADLQEPNDTFVQAFPITPAVEYLGCIPTPSDLDYFRFNVAPHTAIGVELYNLPANYDLYLYDPAQTLLDSSTNAGTTSEIVEYTNEATSGPFYAKVQSGGEWDFYNAYALKLTLTPVLSDTTPPVIISGPTVSNVTAASATISWTTDEASDSAVRFGRKAGMFEDEETDSAPTQTHAVMLTGLQPSAAYRYVVSSTDAAGNTVASQEAFFTTKPAPGSPPPGISGMTLTRMSDKPIYYNIAASVPISADVERVEFTMDGKLLGKAYAPKPGALGLYEFPLVPALFDISREEFFADHTIEGIAVGYGGLTGRFPVQFSPPYTCADIHLEMDYPYTGTTLYFDDGALPPGTSVPIRVYAWKLDETDCRAIVDPHGDPHRLFECEDETMSIERIDFAVRGAQVCTFPGHFPPETVYTCDWDAGGLGAGVYGIRVDVTANEECKKTLFRDVTVERGEPELEVTRQVTRHGNYFEVWLTIENEGTASLVVDRLEDNLTGFQPITKTSDLPPYQVTADCRDLDGTCDISIDVSGDVGGWAETLEPDESLVLGYQVVPVLHPESDDVDYAIGDEPVVVDVVGEPGDQSFNRACVVTSGGESLDEAVLNAQAAADYLIVTHPVRLYALYNNTDVDALLTAMAELAQLKNGILGYLTGDVYDDEGAVHDVILEWGRDMRGSDGIAGNYLSNGYLLIVGEVEVVASYTKRFECWEPWIPNETVHFTDLPYGNTGGSWKNPEMIVSRIIGNNAAEIIIPLQVSINVAKGEPGYEWDRSHALVVAGRGEGVTMFEDNVDDVADVLNDEFSDVVKRKKKVVEENGGDITAEFKANDDDRDVVFYRDHCSRTSWSGVLDRGDFGGDDPVDFGDAKPFVFACCCQAGRFEGGDDIGIAEKFLQHGAAIYIGAVENTDRSTNNEACYWFYDHWVDATNPVGQVFKSLKRHLDGWQEDLWSAQYNLYGDPKYGGEAAGLASTSAILATTHPFSYQVTIPDYEVTTVEGQDYVRIPGGNMVLQPGQPKVPFYTVDLSYPAGYQVQDVTLANRNGLVTATDLHIPTYTVEWDAPGPARAPAAAGVGWWPEETFTWSIEGAPDGTSILTLRIYPFYYNASTTDVQFYKNYSFNIQTITSTIEIAALTTDKHTYIQGEAVQVGLWVTSTSAPQDIVVSIAVESESSGKVVDGLLLRTLQDMESLAFFSHQWDSTGYAPGYYTVKAELRDEAGSVLARADESFRVGIAAGEITTFTVTPTLFDIGAQVALSLTFANTGTVPLTGTAVVQVQAEVGEVIQEFSHDYSNLAPGNKVTFADAWDTAGAGSGSYRTVAYVLYESTATEPHVVSVRTRRSLYLPLILKYLGQSY